MPWWHAPGVTQMPTRSRPGSLPQAHEPRPRNTRDVVAVVNEMITIGFFVAGHIGSTLAKVAAGTRRPPPGS